MALIPQSGGLSMFWMGRQPAPPAVSPDINVLKFTPVSNDPVDTLQDSADRVGHIIGRRFPFTGVGIDLLSEQAESASITGRSSSTKRAGGQLWSGGDLNTELLPTDIIHFLRVIQNAIPQEHAADGTVGTAAPLADGLGTFTEGTESTFDIPAKLTFAAAGLTDGDELTVIGTRRIGLPISEKRPVVKKYTIADGSQDFETDFYFNSITSVLNGTTPLAPTSYNTETYRTSITGFGDALSDALSIMMRKGLMPITTFDHLITNFVLSISDAISAVISTIGGPIFNRRVIGSANDNFGADAAELTDAAGDVNRNWLGVAYPVSDLDFAPAWGSLLQFGDRIVDVIGLDVGINLNLESKRAYRASRFRNKPKRTSTPRQITAAPRVYFENDDELNSVVRDWQEIYVDNEVDDVNISMYNYLDNGRRFKMEFTIPASQLIEVPALAVEGSEDIERDLSFLCTDDNDFMFAVEGDKYTE